MGAVCRHDPAGNNCGGELGVSFIWTKHCTELYDDPMTTSTVGRLPLCRMAAGAGLLVASTGVVGSQCRMWSIPVVHPRPSHPSGPCVCVCESYIGKPIRAVVGPA